MKKTVLDKLVKTVNAIQTIDTSDLVKKFDDDTKTDETENNIPNHDIYITANSLIS